MLRLSLKTEPEWIEIWPGVRLKVRPITSSVIAAAKFDPEFAAGIEGGGIDLYTVTFTRAVAKASILEWSGVGDEDGMPIEEPTAEDIGRLMDFPQIAEAFWHKCVSKAFLLADEKKD